MHERKSWLLEYRHGIADVRELVHDVACFDDYIIALDITVGAMAALLQAFPPGPQLSREDVDAIYAPLADLLNDLTFLRSRGIIATAQPGLAAKYEHDPEFAAAHALSAVARDLSDSDRLTLLDEAYSLASILIITSLVQHLPLSESLQHSLLHSGLALHILVAPHLISELSAEHQQLMTTPFAYESVPCRFPRVAHERQVSIDMNRALLQRQSDAAAAYARLVLQHDWRDAIVAIDALEAIRFFFAETMLFPLPSSDVLSFDRTLTMASLMEGFVMRGPFKVALAAHHVAVMPDHDEYGRTFVLTFPIECGWFSEVVTLERLAEYRREPLAFCYQYVDERERAVALRSIEASVQRIATLEREAFLDATIARTPSAVLSATAAIARSAADTAKRAQPIAQDAADAMETFGWTWLGGVIIHYPQPVKTALLSAFAVFAQKLRSRFKRKQENEFRPRERL